MSFQDIHRGSGNGAPLQPMSGGRSSAGGADPYQSAVSQVFQMSTSLTGLKRLVDMLGGPKDTVELRQRAAGIKDKMASNAKHVTTALKEMQVPAAGQPRQDQVAVAKLASDFKHVLNDFQRVQKQLSEKAMQHKPKIATASRASVATAAQVDGSREADEEAALLAREEQKQELIQLDNMMDYNQALIEERDEGIAQIQQQIGDVNEIFQDLAVLVNDQGAQLVDIESNIFTTAQRTAEARGALVQAQRSQKSSRRLWCWTTFILIAVLGALVFILQL